MSSTRLVSIRDFRANLTRFLKEAQEKGVHFVVMRHSVPIAQVTPVSKEASLETLVEDVKKARKAYKEGKVYTADQVVDMIGS